MHFLTRFLRFWLNKLKTEECPYLLVLFLVFLSLVVTNFPFGSWFTGWDNLHPEFNFWFNIKRSLFAGWQENQGLGLLGGHGFAATLPHTLFLWILSFLIPIQYLRSNFTFLMLFIGSLGSFYLVRQLLKERESELKNTAALAGGLFYMLNFATVQNFYIQLEAFIIHFAALPWLFLSVLLLLKKRSRKCFIFFVLVNFLATSQGFIPPLFLVYMVFLLLVLFINILYCKTASSVKSSTLILLTTFIINAYWLVPVVYFTVNKNTTYLSAYNNLQTTEDFILKNQKFGNLKDLILIKGFIYEAIDTNESGNIFYIFQSWHQHLERPIIQLIGFSFFGIIIFGAIYFFRIFRRHYQVSFVFLLILAFTALAVDIPPFSFVSGLLQWFPVIKQAFRAGFTKFSISLSLFYSIFFAIGIYALLNTFLKRIVLSVSSDKKNTHIVLIISSFSIFMGLVFFSLPSFKGNFLYNRIKINIPESYFQLFDFFAKENPNARIINLPQGWNWGWSIYKWGYSGSGFFWYGIEQPIMDRAFDVWSNFNENYYWELVDAIYSDNFPQFEKILDKYQIGWVVFDENISPYPNVKSIVFSDSFKKYLDNSSKIVLIKSFDTLDKKSKPIKIYKVSLDTSPKDFVFLTKDLPLIGPKYNWNNFDEAYIDYGNYISVDSFAP